MECTIRLWRREDAADLAAACNNKKIQDNLRDGLPYPYTVRDGEDYIQAMLSAAPDSAYAFAITVEDRAVGSIGVFRGQNIHRRTGELGYYVAEPWWGRGICTGAVDQICKFIFARTDLLRIYAEPFARNAASCRVLEKAGFQLEGILRRNAVKNGEVLDMKLYARVKEP